MVLHFRKETNLAIIPARRGSKRVPDKNIREVAGKPLIVWTIEAAIQSGCFHTVVVTTEDEIIAQIAKENGAEVPFTRPKALAQDHSLGLDVIIDTLTRLEKMGRPYDNFCLLHPTSPLRTSDDIIGSYELLRKKNADQVASVCKVSFPVQWCNMLPDDHSLTNFLDREVINVRSQDFPDHYRLNGAIYWLKVKIFLSERTFFPVHNSFAYIMPEERSIDIDNETDLAYAQFIMQRRLRKEP